MKWMKSKIYNYPMDVVIACGIALGTVVICSFIGTAVSYIVAAFIACCSILYAIICFIKNLLNNKGLKCIRIDYALFSKRIAWINQKKSRNMTGCPQYEFCIELCELLKEIPKGTTCYCCTHELIKEKLQKMEKRGIISKVDVTEAYKKDLINLKKVLKTGKCNKCKKAAKCSLFKNEITQFYSIKFVK